MTVWRITNLLPTSLRIEDVGMTLQARGGVDSSGLMSSDSYERSVCLKEHLRRRWVSARPQHQGGPMPIWPFSKPAVRTAVLPVPPPDVPPPAPALPPPPAAAHSDSGLREEVRSLNARMDEVLSLLRAGAASPSQDFRPHGASAAPDGLRHGDPMFIPSSIVPVGADVHISVRKEHADGDGFDEASAALKKARKR